MMPTRRLVLLSAPLALAGCSGTILATQPAVRRTDWPLEPPPPASLAGPEAAPARGVILVRMIEAGPQFQGRGLLTIAADGSLRRSFYQRWAAPPGQAVTAALIDWLRASGDFKAVVGEGSGLNADVAVTGALDTLAADPSRHLARAVLTLVVARVETLSNVPLAQRRLVATAPLTGDTAAAAAAAQTAALAGVLRRAVALVAKVASRHGA